jgi:hypothetical protein
VRGLGLAHILDVWEQGVASQGSPDVAHSAVEGVAERFVGYLVDHLYLPLLAPVRLLVPLLLEVVVLSALNFLAAKSLLLGDHSVLFVGYLQVRQLGVLNSKGFPRFVGVDKARVNDLDHPRNLVGLSGRAVGEVGHVDIVVGEVVAFGSDGMGLETGVDYVDVGYISGVHHSFPGIP